MSIEEMRVALTILAILASWTLLGFGAAIWERLRRRQARRRAIGRIAQALDIPAEVLRTKVSGWDLMAQERKAMERVLKKKSRRIAIQITRDGTPDAYPTRGGYRGSAPLRTPRRPKSQGENVNRIGRWS